MNWLKKIFSSSFSEKQIFDQIPEIFLVCKETAHKKETNIRSLLSDITSTPSSITKEQLEIAIESLLLSYYIILLTQKVETSNWPPSTVKNFIEKLQDYYQEKQIDCHMKYSLKIISDYSEANREKGPDIYSSATIYYFWGAWLLRFSYGNEAPLRENGCLRLGESILKQIDNIWNKI